MWNMQVQIKNIIKYNFPFFPLNRSRIGKKPVHARPYFNRHRQVQSPGNKFCQFLLEYWELRGKIHKTSQREFITFVVTLGLEILIFEDKK